MKLPYFMDTHFWYAITSEVIGDADELRNAIQYPLDHPKVAEEMGRNGRRVVEAYFGLDALAQRFASAIREEPHPELVYNLQF